MILDFSIQNFGPIKDEQILSFEALASTRYEDHYVIHPRLMNGDLLLRQEKPIRLLKLAVIFGPNASGKTTILVALNFLRQLVLDRKVDKGEQLDFLPFAFDSESKNTPTLLKIRFYHKGILFEHQLEINQRCIIKEVVHYWDYNTTGRKRLLFERNTQQHNQVTELTKISDQVIAENNLTQRAIESLQLATLWNESILVGFNKVNFLFKELQWMQEWYSNVLEEMVDNRRNRIDQRIFKIVGEDPEGEAFITEFLHQSDFGIQGFQIENLSSPELLSDLASIISNFNSLLKKERDEELSEKEILEKLQNRPIKQIQVRYGVMEDQYLLPLKCTSLGTKRALILAGLLYILVKDHKVLMIDEFESSLHPDLAEFFLIQYLKYVEHSQLILTTHSRELMQIKELVDRRDIIWFADKNQQLETELYSLGDFSSKELRTESSIYNFYKIGKLGAKPNIT